MKKFGPYELLRRMGAGATAEVYLASGPTPRGEGLLALKVVLAHLADDEGQRAALLNESRTSSMLHHPNVVQVYEVGEVEKRPYLAMELVRGWSASALQKKLKARSERLELAQACELIRQAGLGLHYAHELTGPDGRALGLVHRDVSPQNLIVTEDGQVKVVDFGLAKATAVQATQTTGLKGKLPYMPPEQLRGEPLDRRADVFALGAVLWEHCCGALLYPGATEALVFQQALFLPAPHPDEVVKGLPRPLVELLLRAVERDPSKRFPSALALAEALAALTTPSAKDGLGAKVRACFDPLPRTVSEALGLPETPQPLPRSPSAPRSTRPSRPAAQRPSRPAPPRSGETHDTLDEDEGEAPSSTLDDGDEAAGLATFRADQASRRRRRGTIAAATLIGACLAAGLAVMTRPLLAGAPPPAEPSPIAPAPQPLAPTERHPKKAKHGTLSLRSNVAAFVRERGADLGMTPLSVSLPAGHHVLTLVTADARLSAELSVTLAAGETVSRDVTLK